MRYIQVPGVTNFYEFADFGAINEFRNIPLSELINFNFKIKMCDLLESIINDIRVACTMYISFINIQ